MATVQREPKDLYALFASPVAAEAVLDRLLNSVHLIMLVGKSYRQRQRPTAWDGTRWDHPTDAVAISRDQGGCHLP